MAIMDGGVGGVDVINSVGTNKTVEIIEVMRSLGEWESEGK